MTDLAAIFPSLGSPSIKGIARESEKLYHLWLQPLNELMYLDHVMSLIGKMAIMMIDLLGCIENVMK